MNDEGVNVARVRNEVDGTAASGRGERTVVLWQSILCVVRWGGEHGIGCNGWVREVGVMYARIIREIFLQVF